MIKDLFEKNGGYNTYVNSFQFFFMFQKKTVTFPLTHQIYKWGLCVYTRVLV